MKKREHLYVSPKNVLIWLSVLCMAGSVVTRFIFPGEKGIGVWDQIVLPVAACVLFALITVFNGKERYFKTAHAVALYIIYYCFIFCCAGLGTVARTAWVVGLVILYLAYRSIIANHGKLFWLMIPALAAPLAGQLYLFCTTDCKLFYADILMTAGMILPLLAVRFHKDGQYHPTWGDRVDGRRVRTLPAMSQVSPYIMVERSDAGIFCEDAYEISETERYIRQKRKEGLTGFGLIHVLLAAYCRGVSKYPAINRFLSGQKVYSRGTDIQFCMVVKKQMSTNSPDTAIKIHLNPADTAQDVYNKIEAAMNKAKGTQELDSNFDATAGILRLIPGVLLKFAVWLLKTLDYFGLLPGFLMEISPFHGSIFFTSMGSLGVPPVYHHLYNFGNLPVFGAFGCKYRKNELQDDGTVVQRKYVDFRFLMDERIVDGFYYATFFKHYKHLVTHPEVLDQPPEEVLSDID